MRCCKTYKYHISAQLNRMKSTGNTSYSFPIGGDKGSLKNDKHIKEDKLVKLLIFQFHKLKTQPFIDDY